MAGKLKVFGLLMRKNFLVRRRSWIGSLIGEFLVPFGLVLSIWAVRNFSSRAPRVISNNTIYELQDQQKIISYTTFDRRINVYFAPANDFTRLLINDAVACTHIGKNYSLISGYPTEAEAVTAYLEKESRESIVIIFDGKDVSDKTKHLKYKIRTGNLYKNDLFLTYVSPYDSGLFYYFANSNPIVPFQICIDEAFIRRKLNKPTFPGQYLTQQMPYPPYNQPDTGDTIYRQLFCVLMVIAFMIPLFIETSKASNEKFLGINVLMSMNGVSDALNLLSWLVSGLIFLSISCVLPIMIMLLINTSDAVAYLYYGDPVITWLVFTFFVAHLLTFGVHVTAYFSRSLLVMFALLVLNVGAMVLQTHGFKEADYPGIPYLGILFPNLLLYRALDELNYYESISEGVHWKNLFIVGNAKYKVGGSTGMVLILFMIGIVFHFTMAVYVYAINPGKYGVRKNMLFFLQKTEKKTDSECKVDDVGYDKADGKPFESVQKGLYTPGIQMRNLKKSYNLGFINKTQVHALRGVSIDFYKGQITSLLGHNGAGKTTMMSILTGMMSPTDGRVLVNSKDTKYHMSEIMKDMGLCTQENMLFPSLTVGEQLTFFATLKSDKTKTEIKQSVKAFLEKLKLYEKRHTLPKNLSGGQKRRVCLGMALVGDPSTLILDEPTSGLDPESRRVIWDMLLKMRGQKTILISTHDMEEADILGDRIAILHTGQLRSYGSALFLKKLFGKGNVEVTLSVEPSHDPEKIRYELDCQGEIVNEDGSKMIISIPNSPELPDALDKVERMKEELGISGLSVSLLSLEQVFLRVTQENDDPSKSRKPFVTVQDKLTGGPLFRQTLRALFYKKMTYTLKNLSTLFIMLILILIALAVNGLVLKQTDFANRSMPLRSVALDLYPNPETVYATTDNTFGKAYKSVTESFKGRAQNIQGSNIIEGLIEYAKKDLSNYDTHLIAAAEFSGTKEAMNATALYGKKAIFGLPISINMISNAFAKAFLGDDHAISMSIQLLPTVHDLIYTDTTLINAFSTAVTFVFVFFAIFSKFVLHPLRESATGVKQLQEMTGISCATYWGTMLIFDFVIYLTVTGLIISGLIAMDRILGFKMYYETEAGILMMLFIMFAINGLPLIYSFSFIKMGSSAVVRLLSYVPIGLVSTELIMYAVSQGLGTVYPAVKTLRSIQKPLFLLTPFVSFFHGQLSFYTTSQQNARCKRMPNAFYDTICAVAPEYPSQQKDYCCSFGCYNGKCKKSYEYFNDFKEEISLEESLIYSAVTPLLYFGILIILEYQLIQKLMNKMKSHEIPEYIMDEQVEKEKSFVAQKIAELSGEQVGTVIVTNGKAENNYMRFRGKTQRNGGRANDPVFLVHELRKQYKKLLAVQEVSFSVAQSECFGLLGVNGAGKSTTFRMMTGGELADNGTMYIGDKDLRNNRRFYLSQMGYCPQNDALIKSLNAYDHLRLFARLRGIPEDQVEREVKEWIDRLNLNACAVNPSRTYSGGNKRRLNIAIALIGVPKLVLMDEPTTGVDPGARRSLWNVIQSCQMTGQAVVLTSHSMEECEALCNRLAIMVGGRLVCIGASQELKQRFGAGYDIPIKLHPEKALAQINDIHNEMVLSLNCQLVDQNLSYLMYHVTPNDTTWRKMYNVMEVMKNKYDCIEDYSVLSSTLEQLFLLFARSAGEDPRRKTD